MLVNNYLKGFALASRHIAENIHLVGKEDAMSISKGAAHSEIYYVHCPLNDVERGFQDALLSAFGLDGVCAADCLCRQDHGVFTNWFRNYFHGQNTHHLVKVNGGFALRLA